MALHRSQFPNDEQYIEALSQLIGSQETSIRDYKRREAQQRSMVLNYYQDDDPAFTFSQMVATLLDYLGENKKDLLRYTGVLRDIANEIERQQDG